MYHILLHGMPYGKRYWDTGKRNGVEVKGILSVSEQQAGEVSLPAGKEKVQVRFASPFAAKPVVNVTAQEGFASFAVFDATPAGFSIRLERPAGTLLTFSWLAIPTNDAGTVVHPSAEPSSASSSSSSEAPVPALSDTSSGVADSSSSAVTSDLASSESSSPGDAPTDAQQASEGPVQPEPATDQLASDPPVADGAPQ
jgi:hypothetical protein